MPAIPVAPGNVATVVTRMEMAARPRPRPMPPSPLRLVHWKRPDPAKYRVLFERVGARWLWYSRLLLDDARLMAIIGQPHQAVYAVIDPRGVEVGLLELFSRDPAETVIDFLALVPELTGQQHGRWLIANALAIAWRPGVKRVWLNTCSLDHPSAMGFYRASGFSAVARWVDVFPDPRLSGLLPRDAAPQIPLVGTLAAS